MPACKRDQVRNAEGRQTNHFARIRSVRCQGPIITQQIDLVELSIGEAIGKTALAAFAPTVLERR